MEYTDRYFVFDYPDLDFLVDAMPLVKFCKVYRYQQHINKFTYTEIKYALYDFNSFGAIPIFMTGDLDDNTLIILALKGVHYRIVNDSSNVDDYVKAYLHE